MHNALLVAILAAGASRRLGQPKQLVSIDGAPLLRRQCRIALEAQIGAVVVILGSHAGPCAGTIAGLSVSIRRNEQWPEGIASSIRNATRAAIENGASALLLLLADQYRLTTADLQRLHAASAASDYRKLCRARHENYAGSPVIFPSECFAALLQLEGDEGARRIFPTLDSAALIDIAMPNATGDLDLPEQLAEIVERGA